MPSNKPIPLTDHISRHCKRQEYHPELDEIDASAFRLRLEDGETELSVNRLEHFSGSRMNQMTNVYLDIKKRKTINSNSLFGILNAGRTIQYVYEKSKIKKVIRILTKPNYVNPSHCGIYDILPEEELVRQLLPHCVEDILFVKKIKKNLPRTTS